MVEGVRERLFPGDWAPGVRCGVQCVVGVVYVGAIGDIPPLVGRGWEGETC